MKKTILIFGAFLLLKTASCQSDLHFPPSGTVTITSDKLSVFAPTTSSELAGVISDETGTNKLVYSDAPTITRKNTNIRRQ